MKTASAQLVKSTGYRFKKKALLEAALTHPSYRYETAGVEEDNQRLEFLGDAVLGMVSAVYLYRHFASWQEGELTRMRSRLTNRETLAAIASTLELGKLLRLGKGERGSGGRSRESNLADAMEAVLGAIYLDGGLRGIERVFKRCFIPFIEQFLEEEEPDNPKGALQERLQSRLKASPVYDTVKVTGPAHARHFTVQVSIHGDVLGQGEGSSKRQAEMAAAREALRKIDA